MSLKTRSTDVDVPAHTRPLSGPICQCRVEFYREEFKKHRQCLERQREYYSEVAIAQAENALTRILQEIEQLCQRDDACEVVGQLLRQFDVVTKLSAWTEPKNVH
jgi:hypothetical protein